MLENVKTDCAISFLKPFYTDVNLSLVSLSFLSSLFSSTQQYS